MNDKRHRIPSNRSKQSQSRQKENSSDTAMLHRTRLMKYQNDSIARPPQKPQSIYLKLSQHEKELIPNNNNITNYTTLSKTKGINKTAIGTEYNASQKFLKIFPDNIDTRLGIGDMLLNDDSILLTDSNLINDMIHNNILDSNELSNAKLSFNEWNLKILSSANSKKGGHLQSGSNPKNKLNEIIANVTPFDSNYPTNKVPTPHQVLAIAITDEGEKNNNYTNSNNANNMLVSSVNDSKDVKKITQKLYRNNRNITKQALAKHSKAIHNHSFHNESSSGRTTVTSVTNKRNHITSYKPKDFSSNNTNNATGNSEKIKKNNSKERRLKSKEKIEPKSKDTIMKYLKIQFGDQLESFNEKVLDEKLNASSLKDLFKQLAFYALDQESEIKEITKQNKRLEKEVKEKNKENFELAAQLTDIKSNLIGLIKTTDKITNKKTNQSNKSIAIPQQKKSSFSEQTIYSLNSH